MNSRPFETFLGGRPPSNLGHTVLQNFSIDPNQEEWQVNPILSSPSSQLQRYVTISMAFDPMFFQHLMPSLLGIIGFSGGVSCRGWDDWDRPQYKDGSSQHDMRNISMSFYFLILMNYHCLGVDLNADHELSLFFLLLILTNYHCFKCRYDCKLWFFTVFHQFVHGLMLFQGDFGPFFPQIAAQVPLWLAVALKRRGKCAIRHPEWMSVGENSLYSCLHIPFCC